MRPTSAWRGALRLAVLAGAHVVALAGLFAAAPAAAADEPLERLVVADPYLELHTGPGRGYPVFFVVARDESIEVELRHTDWFKVRTTGGKEGWVQREQLERTLTAAGSSKTFRDVMLDDYLRRRVELGMGWGTFKSEPVLKLWTSYKVAKSLNIEATVGQVQGVFSGTTFWHLNLNAEPWNDKRISPFFGVGVGQFKNIPNASLVDAVSTSAKLANASVGLRYHISERFVARIDYTLYTAFLSDSTTGEYRAATAGISFFF